MSRFYVFELPEKIFEGLTPFKFDFPDDDDASKQLAVESESESEQEPSSESDSSDEGDTDAKTTRKPAKQSNFSSAVTKYLEDDDISMEQWQWANRAHITGTPYVYFTNPSVFPENKVLSIYKSWFDAERIIDRPVEEVQSLPPDGKSCILMVGSGDFAGAIFQHKKHHHKTNISNPFANLVILESKTFHRYTTRRKQGGAQSANDNANGKANSAGSTIRRANERALKDEIKALLHNWRAQLDGCHRIFFRAPGRSNQQLLNGYPDAPIGKSDPRFVQIPFATSKPTLNECKSAWIQLTQAQVVNAPKPPQIPKQESPAPVKEQNMEKEEKQKPQVSFEEEITSRIADLIKRSKLPSLKTLIDTELDGNWDFTLEPSSKYFAYPTPLLYASHFDKHNVVSQLLNWGANPLIPNEHGHVVGDIAAPHKKTREALQIARHSLGEKKWDWEKAKVGPAATKDQLLNRDLQEKLKIQRETEQLVAEQETQEKKQRMERLIKKHGSGRLTGGLYEASRGMTEDELKQVERERRARAAEARLAKMGG